MKNIKILHLSNSDIRIDPRIIKELKALEKLDYKHCLGIGIDRVDDQGLNISDMAGEVKAEIVTCQIKSYRGIFNKIPRQIAYFFRLLEITYKFTIAGIRFKPNIVHCHGPFVLLAGVIIKLFNGCKLVYDAHELESNKNGQSLIVSKSVLLIEKISWKSVDLLVSVSDSILEWYNKKLGMKPVVLILNSPQSQNIFKSEGKIKNNSNYFRHLYKIAPDKKIFLYLGAFIPGRGIEHLLTIFKSKISNAHIVFMGYGKLGPMITDYANSSSNIHIHHALPQNEFIAIASSADIGVCMIENISLSDYYSLPNKFFEYIFAGLTVLGSNFPEIRKYIEKYSLGMCCEADSESLESSILNISAQPRLYPINGVHELSWEYQAEKLVKSYNSII
jgi:glycosyltransferase involved in cell wall biosynthesis